MASNQYSKLIHTLRNLAGDPELHDPLMEAVAILEGPKFIPKLEPGMVLLTCAVMMDHLNDNNGHIYLADVDEEWIKSSMRMSPAEAEVFEVHRDPTQAPSWCNTLRHPLESENHVDEWLSNPSPRAKDQNENYARFFLNFKRMPAAWQYAYKPYIEQYKLFCDHEGTRYRVTGASRLGDIWLAKNHDQENRYNLRVDLKTCSNWGPAP